MMLLFELEALGLIANFDQSADNMFHNVSLSPHEKSTDEDMLGWCGRYVSKSRGSIAECSCQLTELDTILRSPTQLTRCRQTSFRVGAKPAWVYKAHLHWNQLSNINASFEQIVTSSTIGNRILLISNESH